VVKETYGLAEQPRTIKDYMQLAQRAQKSAGNVDQGRLANIEHLLKQVYGVPLETSIFGEGINTQVYQSTLRAFRASTRLALLGGPNAMVGQMQEFAGVIGQNGVAATKAAIPWAWELRKKILAGDKMDSALMRMAVDMGFASDLMTGRVVQSQMVEDGQLAANGAGKRERFARVMDRASAWGNRASGQLSGENFTRNLQEGITFYASAEFLYKTAKGDHSPSITDKELSQWGTTRSEWNHVLSQLKKYGKDTELGYHEPNLEQWKDALGQIDLAGMSAYERILLKDAQLGVQFGQSTLIPKSWFTTEGKIFTQLMPYAYSSYFQRLLPALRRRDLRTANMVFMSMSAAALGMLALTYMQAIGREDRQEFLEQRLDPTRFALNTLGRSSFLSLIPRFVDAGMAAAGESPAFAGSRLSGLGQDGGAVAIMLSNPSVDRLKSILGAARGLIRAPLDSEYDYSQRDLRNAIRASGLPNWMGTHNIIMQLGEDLPERPN
jgi:hypothetical protein